MPPRRAELPPSLRASANRRARPRRPPSERLRSAAAAGIITRGNTRPGTAGRQAADAAEYERRQSRGRRLGATTARAAVGHGGPLPPASITAMFRDLGFSTVENPTAAERRRLNRWNSLVAQLVAGRLSPKGFERRVKAWRPFRGAAFEWNAEIITATMGERRDAGETTYEYTGRRA